MSPSNFLAHLIIKRLRGNSAAIFSLPCEGEINLPSTKRANACHGRAVAARRFSFSQNIFFYFQSVCTSHLAVNGPTLSLLINTCSLNTCSWLSWSSLNLPPAPWNTLITLVCTITGYYLPGKSVLLCLVYLHILY